MSADPVYKSYCPWMSLSVPSAGTQNFMDWRLLVKERIANIKNNMKKIRNIFLEDLENIFGFTVFGLLGLIDWFNKTHKSVLANQPIVQQGKDLWL